MIMMRMLLMKMRDTRRAKGNKNEYAMRTVGWKQHEVVTLDRITEHANMQSAAAVAGHFLFSLLSSPLLTSS
jgi:hypothetical protein